METVAIGNSKPLSTAAMSPTTCHRRSQRPIRRGAGRCMSRLPGVARSWSRARIQRRSQTSRAAEATATLELSRRYQESYAVVNRGEATCSIGRDNPPR